jgi:hypothetical protein
MSLLITVGTQTLPSVRNLLATSRNRPTRILARRIEVTGGDSLSEQQNISEDVIYRMEEVAQ